ncbi:MAG: S8 family serine peptidase [Candidatus Marithrix sp.]
MKIFRKFYLIICLVSIVLNVRADILYAVQDKGLNDSQFFTINPNTLEIKSLPNGNYPGYDIEALDAHPQTSVLYAASGDDAVRNKGYLYTVNSQTGKLSPIGYTGFDEIEALSFHPIDGSLWAWAKSKSGQQGGLVKIPNPQIPDSNTLYPNSMQVEAMTWDNKGTFLYMAANTKLLVYDINSVLVNTCNLSGQTEALEILPDGRLLVGMHGESNLLPYKVVNAQTCQIEDGGSIATGFDDVEGIAWNSIPAPTIDLEHGIHDTIIIEAGSKKYTGFTLDLNMHEDYDYLVTFEQTVVPEGGISLFHRYSPSGNVFYNSAYSLISERIDAFVPGIYKVTSKVNVVGTGVSDEHVLTVRVVEPGWDGDLSILPPTMYPSAINLDVSIEEIFFNSIVTGTESPPQFLTLEEIDENGSLIRTVGQLNDNGINGDRTAGDYFYSGTFTVIGGIEGKKFYRTIAIFNGDLVVSDTNYFNITRFPIGTGPSTTNHLVEDPNTDQLVYLDSLSVSFKDEIAPERIEEIIAAENAILLGTSPKFNTFHLRINSDDTLETLWDIVAAFKAYSEAEYVDIAVQTTVSAYPDDPESYETTGNLRSNLTTVRADETWLIAKANEPIIFVDTGIDYNHLDLNNKVTKERNFFESITSIKAYEPMDEYINGHGTHVAGIAAASTNNAIGVAGVAWDSEIIAIRGMGDEYKYIPEAIKHAVDIKKAKIINISGGVYNSFTSTSFMKELDNSVQDAFKKGVLIIAAAHNDGKDTKRYPCTYPEVLCVGNSDAGKRASNSNFGSWVDIAAPGVGVMSTISTLAKDEFTNMLGKKGALEKLVANGVNDNYGVLSGNSMSTPLVSGAAAILWSIHPTWTPQQIKDRLLITAEPLANAKPLEPIGNQLDIFEAVFNGSFETGDLSEWKVAGACLAIQKLGPITPNHRKYMAACTSGPDYNKITSLSKVLTVQPGVTTLPISMDFNFVTEEYPEYINAGYNDSFSVRLKDDTGVVIFETELASVDSSTFCTKTITEDLAPGNGDKTAGQTGWQTVGTVFNIPNTGGVYQIEISFDIKTDGADNAYDSGILIDHVQLEYALNLNPKCM